MIEIIGYDAKYQPEFRSLNEEWLDQYNLKENHDLLILEDPITMIVDQGGEIFLAREDGIIVGTAALMKEHDGVYELAKMSVHKNFRNRGIGNMLIETCLLKAKSLHAKKVVLFSNHQLKPALRLYEKYGFEYIPVENSPFVTADIKMQLILQ